MSRRPHVPTYRLHKRSGQAVVTLPDGFGSRRDVLLGPHDSPESMVRFQQFTGVPAGDPAAVSLRPPPAVREEARRRRQRSS